MTQRESANGVVREILSVARRASECVRVNPMPSTLAPLEGGDSSFCSRSQALLGKWRRDGQPLFADPHGKHST